MLTVIEGLKQDLEDEKRASKSMYRRLMSIGRQARTLAGDRPMDPIAVNVLLDICKLCDLGSRASEETKEMMNDKDRMEFVFVPAGPFIMGSKGGYPDERRQHTVTLPGYWIGKTEVTVAQYRKFCQDAEQKMPDYQGGDNYPVVNVSWNDAAAYCEWAGTRLPTEAEWEKAARGTDGRIYPWGNTWDTGKCSNSSGGEGMLMPVGSYPEGASPCGALDMAGNVWEWCADWYDDDAYQRYANGDLTPPASGPYRVFRGSSWCLDNSYFFRTAYRSGDPPDDRGNDLGFRAARTEM